MWLHFVLSKIRLSGLETVERSPDDELFSGFGLTMVLGFRFRPKVPEFLVESATVKLRMCLDRTKLEVVKEQRTKLDAGILQHLKLQNCGALPTLDQSSKKRVSEI